MELRQLNYFICLSQTLNFSQAAKRLFITQGTLSQQISQLEDELGQKLFERTSRTVRLTDAGEQLLPLALKTVDDSMRCVQKMNDLKKHLGGTLRIGTAYCFDEFIVEAIKDFHRKYPKVKLEVEKKTANQLLAHLREGKIDLMLAYQPTEGCEDLSVKELFTAYPHAIMRRDHPLAKNLQVSVSELKKYGLALPGLSYRARVSFDSFVSVDTSDLDIRMEIDDLDLLVEVIRSTGLVGVFAPVGVERYFSDEPDNITSIVAIPIEGLESAMKCSIHTLKTAIQKAAVKAFADIIDEVIQSKDFR